VCRFAEQHWQDPGVLATLEQEHRKLQFQRVETACGVSLSPKMAGATEAEPEPQWPTLYPFLGRTAVMASFEDLSSREFRDLPADVQRAFNGGLRRYRRIPRAITFGGLRK